MKTKVLKQVPKEEFFGEIYSKQLNVHPTIISEWDEKKGYICEWKFPNGDIFGTSTSGDGIGNNKEFFVRV